MELFSSSVEPSYTLLPTRVIQVGPFRVIQVGSGHIHVHFILHCNSLKIRDSKDRFRDFIEVEVPMVFEEMNMGQGVIGWRVRKKNKLLVTDAEKLKRRITRPEGVVCM